MTMKVDIRSPRGEGEGGGGEGGGEGGNTASEGAFKHWDRLVCGVWGGMK